MSKLKISPGLLTGILVALSSFAAFGIRVFLSYGEIFKGDWIKYASADAYFFMRLVDVTAVNFPNLTAFDPFNTFPGGNAVAGTNMFVRMMAGIASLFGIINPDQRVVDIVGVFTPAVLGALTVVIIFFIGRAIFGRWGGILSALMAALLPGEFLSRTKLGFTDYHCFEIFLTSLFILFIILAMKAAKNNDLHFADILKRNWKSLRNPVIYSVLGGLTFAIYAMTWTGSPLFLFVVFTFFVVQFIIDHMKRRNADYLTVTGALTFFVALLVLLPSPVGIVVKGALSIGIIAFIGLGGLSRLFAARNLKPVLYPAAVVIVGLAGFGLFYLVFRNAAVTMLNSFVIFNPTGASLTTIEMQPLISGTYGHPLTIVWNNYNTTFFLAFIAMALLVYEFIKNGESGKTMLLIWSIIILISNLAQRRFGYYYGVNVALLVGYLSWTVIDFARSRIFTEKLKQAMVRAKDAKTKMLRKKQKQSFVAPYFMMVLVVVIVFFTAYWWSIPASVEAARSAPYAPSDAWYTVLDWMRENTPEPLEDAEEYYKLHENNNYWPYSSILSNNPEAAKDPALYEALDVYYPYPESAYGVLSWWDYGYWIARIGHRIPVANPGQDPRAIKDVAEFFLAKDEASANAVVDRLDTDYIIIDYSTAYVEPSTGGGKFWAVITWASQNVTDYFDAFLVPTQESGQYQQQVLYYPEYYQSMAVRMYNFNCEAYTPTEVLVIGYVEQKDDNGNTYKVVNEAEQFTTYEEAKDFLDSKEEGNYRIVGGHPMISCVPLEALEDYEVAYESPQGYQLTSGNLTAEVKVFKYNN